MPEIMIHDCNMYYEEHGTGQHTVLFLHGLYANGLMFNQQMVSLRDRYRCVTLDLRGQGKSSSPRQGFDLKSIASDIMQFINVRRYGACHIIGAGMGGQIGLHLAVDHPLLVRSLTLLGTTGNGLSVAEQRHNKARALRIKLFGMRFVTPKILREWFSPEFLIENSEKAIVSHWRNEFLKTKRQKINRAISGVLQSDGLQHVLHKLRRPTLIISGEKDQIVGPDPTSRLHNSIRGSNLFVVPGAGHMVSLEQPELVNAKINEFIGRLQQQTASTQQNSHSPD